MSSRPETSTAFKNVVDLWFSVCIIVLTNICSCISELVIFFIKTCWFLMHYHLRCYSHKCSVLVYGFDLYRDVTRFSEYFDDVMHCRW